MGEKNNRVIVRDSLNTFGTTVLNTSIQIMATFIVLRRVEPEISGLNGQAQLWGSGLCTILSLSITSAIIYFVSKYKIQKVRRAIRKLTLLISIKQLILFDNSEKRMIKSFPRKQIAK